MRRRYQRWPNVTLPEDIFVRQWKHWPVNGPFIKILKLYCHLVESLRQWQNNRTETVLQGHLRSIRDGFRVSASELRIAKLHFQGQCQVKIRRNHHCWRLSSLKKTLEIDEVHFVNLLICFSYIIPSQSKWIFSIWFNLETEKVEISVKILTGKRKPEVSSVHCDPRQSAGP